jgi:hypothetical protein
MTSLSAELCPMQWANPLVLAGMSVGGRRARRIAKFDLLHR